MNQPQPMTGGPQPLATTQHPAVVRLAWIFGTRDDLLLLRLPVLAEIAVRRHKVLAVAADLEPDHNAALLRLGIETAVVPSRGTWLNPLTGMLSRRRLAQMLHDWRANAVVIEDADHLEFDVRAAAQAGLQSIYPVLPALERGPAPPGNHTSWRTTLASASAVFVPTANDCRLIGQSCQRSQRIAVLPPASVDLNEICAQPLPSLGDGLVLLGAASANQATSSAFVEAGKTLAGRCHCRSIDLSGFREGPAIVRDPAVDWIHTSGNMSATLRSAVETAHVVVVDDISPTHMLLLVTALAMGRPVLVADVARYRDFVDAGANGWLFADGDAAALAASMAAMLKRPDLLAGMARTARQKAERKLDRKSGWQALFDIVGIADLRRKAA